MDVCGDREDPIPGIDGSMVANAVTPGTAHVTYQPVWDEAAPTVAKIARPGDLVITVGCGDVTESGTKDRGRDSAPYRGGAMTATATVRRASEAHQQQSEAASSQHPPEQTGSSLEAPPQGFGFHCHCVGAGAARGELVGRLLLHSTCHEEGERGRHS